MAAPVSYKLRAILVGHEKDVRGLYPSYFPDGSFVSGSRDVTARLWKPNDTDVGFTGCHSMGGHSGYINCICAMPPDDKYPQGLILTGSQDNMIFAFTPSSTEPVFRLTGHKDNVCALAAGKFGTVLSGSWDKTARVWLNEKCVMTLEGHEAAVWAVAVMPEKGYMLTGSADKSIRLWRAGKCERILLGHTDCVRGLAVLNSMEFLSCSNDATVRQWSIDGPCTHTYYSHTNYVYSVAVLSNGIDFVTSGEDRSLKVWVEGECKQTITHPAQSVWCVCCLPNGDIVTGSSDSVVRVFTQDETRMADPDQQKAFDEEVASSAIPTQVGDLKKEDLPGPEVLHQPGKREGQTMMVQKDGKVEAHQWNAAEYKWVKVGDVVGASGTTAETSGKSLFEGKEYDYVFTVDIEEGKPALKLPYNVTDDPWFAAQTFLQRNDLSALFLDQVANFIVENTKGSEITQTTSSCSDPLTGGGRYVPGSAPPREAPPPTTAGGDPFTGGGRYIPQGTHNPGGGGPDKESSLANQYFPKYSYISFDQANPTAILGKLLEFNQSVPDKLRVGREMLESMKSLMEGNEANKEQVGTLWNILQWPQDRVFPALDVLRLAIRLKSVNGHFFTAENGQSFLVHLMALSSAEKPGANHMLVLRTMCNAFKQKPGEAVLTSSQIEIISTSLLCKDTTNKNIHVALISLLLNYSVYLYHNSDTESKAVCLSALAEVMKIVKDPEGQFRMLVCLGTLVWGDTPSKNMAKSLGIQRLVSEMAKTSELPKVGECAKYVIKLFS